MQNKFHHKFLCEYTAFTIVKKITDYFWSWYERNYVLNVTIAASLFILQLIHLYWLTGHVVVSRIWEIDLWAPQKVLQLILVLFDYTEIPALFTASLIYINDLRKSFNLKSVGFLVLLNSQWLHIFWITDEFVINQFIGRAVIALPLWLAWIAIFIDYLELPVIFDTTKKFLTVVWKGVT